ncbi:MAG TPA: N-acetylmuramic acid 6-phosphate etherase [Ferruginibacter sp.]|nr:N-acetylmuramic acid 6-phosphate etherase [Ferruginibacter sp.]HMP20177.1 N-acetylmuramic acid 6-phosphate etherase [Ferruginibacter sp.]
MPHKKITESASLYRHLEKMPLNTLLATINKEDAKVHKAVQQALPAIEKLVAAAVDKMLAGGRLFYIGAGTSGRLGVLDASECPATFGVPSGLVVGIIAGGKRALTTAVEKAEDDKTQGWKDLLRHKISHKDVVVGIAASGATPYVLAALQACKKNNIITGCIVCNPGSPVSHVAQYPVQVIVGPEIVTGSTRMKSGTAQKLVLNMLSTSIMIQLGRVQDNRMVHMQLSNAKLVERGIQMLMEQLPLKSRAKARQLLLKHGSVKKAIDSFLT